MRGIDENYIHELIEKSKNPSEEHVRDILAKTKDLKRRTLEEAALLLSVEDEALQKELYQAARTLKDTIYGDRVVLFAPLYINNHCVNNCAYCGFRKDNDAVDRVHLTPEEITRQTEWLLRRGHMRVLMVAGEAAPPGYSYIDYLEQSLDAIYAAEVNGQHIKRINVNCAPLTVDDFKRLKAKDIGTFQCFQETYHEETYKRVHISGPKSFPDMRLDGIDRAFQAGIDDYGIGVLYGLYDYKFETLAMLQHVEYCEKTFGVGPHTLSMPRLEPAKGVDVAESLQYPVDDIAFRKIVATLRLCVPYTGIIMSTRESAQLRDELLDLGVSQISAESSTTPGGYVSPGEISGEGMDVGAATEGNLREMGSQFDTADHRSLDEIVHALMDKGYWPSFCAACYRKERTGETFMKLATPGHIKAMCAVNGLATLSEYLLDHATPETREEGVKFLEGAVDKLDDHNRKKCQKLIERIRSGERDVYV